jgi:hypothetical protein
MRIVLAAEMLDNVREVCRQHNIAEQTLYRWRQQFRDLDSEAKRLRTLFRDEMDRLLSTLFVQVLLYFFSMTGEQTSEAGAPPQNA